MPLLLKLLYIVIGASLGACCRYGLEELLHSSLAVWLINTSSCLLMGFGVGYLMASTMPSLHKETFHLLLLTGFAGGYATFAHYIFYCVEYFYKGQLMLSFIYTVTSLVVGVGCMVLGLWLGGKLA